jgi:hypothetical protein
MSTLNTIFLTASAGVAVACSVIVGSAVHAYIRTHQPVMLALTLGFTLVLAGTLVTVAGVIFGQFTHIRMLLTVNHGLSMTGILVIAYTLST